MWLLGRLGKRQGAATAAKLPADRAEAEEHHRPGCRFRHPMVRDRNRATERAGAVVVAVDDKLVLSSSKQRVVQPPEFIRTDGANQAQRICVDAIPQERTREVDAPRTGI